MKLCRTCRYGSEYELDKPCVVYREDCPLYEKEGDGMTNKEAIEELKAIKSEYSNKQQFHEACLMRSEHEALDMAIKALEDIPEYKDAYNKGWDDGAKATYEHLKMCEEEQEPKGKCMLSQKYRDWQFIQEPKTDILDKIRAEIEGYKSSIDNAISEDEIKIEGMKVAYSDCLKIIDKYKAESDHKCHDCKHYTSGEYDGSCDSYVCEHYSGWESEE